MKNLRQSISGLGLLCALWLPCGAGAAVWQVSVDTSSVIGQVGWLTFDLIDGDAVVTPSSVMIDPFATDGTLGPNVVTAGSVSGTLPSAVTLDDAQSPGNSFNEYMQDITLGNSITFTFTTSGALPAGTPDGFSFFLFAACAADPTELTATNGCVPFESLLETPDPSGALFLFDIGGGFQGGEPYSELVRATEVTANDLPEPGTLALGMAALLAAGAGRPVRKRGVAQARPMQ